MSRAVDILNKIKNGESYNLDIARSRAEEILIDICNSTNLSSDARSRYEELLLCIKNGTATSLTAQTRLEEILLAIINGTDFPSTYQSELEQAFIEAFQYIVIQNGDTLTINRANAEQEGDVVLV